MRHALSPAFRRTVRLTGVLLAAIALCTYAVAQDATVTLPGATAASGVFDGASLVVVNRTVPSGEMLLYRAYDGSYRNPIVVIEGFDPQNTTAPADVYSMLNTWGGVDIIRASGRSVWVVNFGDGGGALTANASLVSSAIELASNWGGLSNAQVDVVGLSMGGVIARYALTWDEQNGGLSDGHVRLFISGDSPQQGANGPPSLQEILLFADDPGLTPMLGCDAALSLLYTSVRSYETNGCLLGALPSSTDWTGSSAAHDWFYNTLNSLNGDGYPNGCRNVAVSNGSLSPQPHNVGDPIYDARTYLSFLGRIQLCSETYGAYAMDVAPGSRGESFAPGNIREDEFELDEHFVATFIPTDSALDIRNGVSMFDRTMHQSQAVDHGTITPETTDFILEEILGAERRYNPKYLPDGIDATVYGWIVTSTQSGFFYIESPDRVSGVRVDSTESVQEGDVLTVRGSMSTVEGERRMTALSVLPQGTASVPRPLAMGTRTLGGTSLGPSTGGVTGGIGLNNIGLLVTTWGKVTQVGDGYLYIDDGSGLKDGTLTGTAENIGVRVVCDPTGCSAGDYLQVTGISSCFRTPSGDIARRVLARSPEDIVLISAAASGP